MDHRPCPAAAAPGRCEQNAKLVEYRQRVLRDLPWQGRPVLIHFRSRRFRCSSASCPRRTFIERLSGFARVHARRTERVSALHRYIGLAMGGEAGARLVERLAMPVSADTLLRVARQSERAVKPSAPRVLGVDC